MIHEAQIPKLGVVTDIRVDTPDIKTFRVQAIGGGRAVEVRFGCTVPGQILDGTIVLSSTSKTVECAVKAVKGGE